MPHTEETKLKISMALTGKKRGPSAQRGISRTDILKHGHASIATGNKYGSRTYSSWKSMLSRCYHQSSSCYSNYGGRGIKVCKRWHKFENFLSDMGERPLGTSIDREHNDKDYVLSNCRWATRKEQSNHRRNNRLLTLDGHTMNVQAWAEKLGMKPATIHTRLARGKSDIEALQPPRWTRWTLSTR